MAASKARDLQSDMTSCSVCLEPVNGTHERSIAKLICGHTFHLDCIGSAFNAKGSMQCPNCRQIEHGDWLYGNGCPQQEDSMLDDMILEDYDVELEMLARVSEFIVRDDNIWQCHWFPYQEMHTQLEFSVGNENLTPTPYAELVVGVLVDENSERTRSVQPSPYVHAQAPVSDRRTRGFEGSAGVAVASSAAHMHHGAAYEQHFSSVEQRGRRRQSPAALEPNGVAGGTGLEGSAGHTWHLRSRHDGVRRRLSASASEFLPRPESLHHASPTATVQEPVWEAQPRSNPSFGHRRRRSRTSRFGGLNPSEPEGQRLAPSQPLLDSFGTHGGIPAPYALAPLHARHLYPSAEEIDGQSSRPFHHPRFN